MEPVGLNSSDMYTTLATDRLTLSAENTAILTLGLGKRFTSSDTANQDLTYDGFSDEEEFSNNENDEDGHEANIGMNYSNRNFIYVKSAQVSCHNIYCIRVLPFAKGGTAC